MEAKEPTPTYGCSHTGISVFASQRFGSVQLSKRTRSRSRCLHPRSAEAAAKWACVHPPPPSVCACFFPASPVRPASGLDSQRAVRLFGHLPCVSCWPAAAQRCSACRCMRSAPGLDVMVLRAAGSGTGCGSCVAASWFAHEPHAPSSHRPRLGLGQHSVHYNTFAPQRAPQCHRWQQPLADSAREMSWPHSQVRARGRQPCPGVNPVPPAPPSCNSNSADSAEWLVTSAVRCVQESGGKSLPHKVGSRAQCGCSSATTAAAVPQPGSPVRPDRCSSVCPTP